MENFRSNGGRKGVSFRGQTPTVSKMSAPPTSMETVLERLQRLEAQFADEDGCGEASRGGCYQRPDPDPPYGMPPLWKSSAWVPDGSTATGPESRRVATTPASQPPTMQGFRDSRASGSNQQQLGFRANPSVGPQQPSTWDLGLLRTEWDHPAHCVGSSAQGSELARLFKLEPPVFDGTEAHNWVTRVQYYFDHILVLEEHRLHYVVMLFAPSITDWIFSYRASNPTVSWRQFLDDVRWRFDPHYFVNYVELLSKLSQMGPLAEYNREFERMMNQIQGVSEETLLAIYLTGLRQPLRNQVRFQHPSSVASAMALAVEFDIGNDRGASQRRQWQPRDVRASGTSGSNIEQPPSASATATPARPRDYSKLPVVRLSAA